MTYLKTNQNNFGYIKYPSSGNPKATVLTSGCGPCSALMILENMTENRFKMQEWINWVVSTGARVSGGTNMSTLSAAMAKKYGFTVTKTSDESTLRKHLQEGGMAIGNCGGKHGTWKGLFSTGGHYFTIAGYTKDGYYVILDPAWTKNKYTNQNNTLSKWRSQRVKSGGSGVVYVNAANLNEDTKTRTPSYYLFSLPAPVKQTEPVEEEEMRYKTINDVPEVYRKAVQKRIDNGTLRGDGNGNINVYESAAWQWTIADRGRYETLEDIPQGEFRDIIKELMDKGYIKGNGNGVLDLSKDMVRTYVINYRAGLYR